MFKMVYLKYSPLIFEKNDTSFFNYITCRSCAISEEKEEKKDENYYYYIELFTITNLAVIL